MTRINNLKKMVCVVVFATAGMAFAGTWQDVEGDWNGVFNVSAHWNGGLAAPAGVNTIAHDGAFSVTLPPGGYSTMARLAYTFYPSVTEQALFDTRNSSFLLATQTLENVTWPNNALEVNFNGRLFLALSSSGDARWNKQAMMRFENGYWSGSTPEPGLVQFAVHGGTLDFSKPDGEHLTQASNGAKPTVTFCDNSYYSSGDYTRTRLLFADGANSSLPSFTMSASPVISELCYQGGTHYVRGTFSLMNSSSGSGARSNIVHVTDSATVEIAGLSVKVGTARVNDVRVDGGATLTMNGILPETNSCVHFTVSEASTLKTGTSAFQMKSASVVELDTIGGSVLNFDGEANIGAYASSKTTSDFATARIRVLNSTLMYGGEVKLGEDFAPVAQNQITLSVTNGAVVSVGTKSLLQCGGSIASKDSDWNIYRLVVGNSAYAVVPPVFDFDGGTFYISNEVAVGTVGPGRATFTGGSITNAPSAWLSIGGQGKGRLEILGGQHALAQVKMRMGLNAGGEGTLLIDGADTVFAVNGFTNDHLYCGAAAGGVGRIVVSNGLFKIKQNESLSYRLYVGHMSGSTGMLEVAGGKAEFNSFSPGISSGTGFITFSGGTSTMDRLAVCTENDSIAGESVVRQTGGTVTVAPTATTDLTMNGVAITSNTKTNRRCRLELDGGDFTANRIFGGSSSVCNGGTGWTTFKANGGTLHVNAVAPRLLETFDEATLGAKGLTVDSSGFDATIKQGFTSQAGASGLLVLTGAGTKTLAGTNTLGTIVAAGGSVVFAASAQTTAALVVTNGATVVFNDVDANRTLTGLVLGDATTYGTLCLAAGSTLEVTGTAVVGKARLVLSGNFTTGMSYDLLHLSTPMSTASAEAWARAVATGLGTGQACDLIGVDDGEGGQILRMAVREGIDLGITVDPSVTSNRLDAIMYGTSEKLTTEVGAGATLTLAGSVGSGSFEKTGAGRTYLTSVDNAFLGNISLMGGLLSASSLAAFGSIDADVYSILTLGTGTLEISGSGTIPQSVVVNTTATNETTVVKNNGDFTMCAPATMQGGFLKRGQGRLTLMTSTAVAFSQHAGKDVKNTAPSPTAIVFDDFGTPPTNHYSSLTVAEGELVLAGTALGAYTMAGEAAAYIGIPSANLAAHAGLVVDGVSATFKGNHFHLGSGVSATTCNKVQPYLVVTNGGYLQTTSFQLAWNGAGSSPKVRLDNGTLYVTEYLYFLRSGSEGSEPTLVAANGSKLWVPGAEDGNVNRAFKFMSPSTVVFDHSTFSNLKGAGGRLYSEASDGKMIFRNESALICDNIKINTDTSKLTLTFDGSTWIPGTPSSTSFTTVRPERVFVKTEGEGLILAPPENVTLTFPFSISGTGKLVKNGAGTLKLTAPMTNLTGALDVRAGTMAFSNTVAFSDLKITGTGTLEGGMLTRTTFPVMLDENFAVAEKINLNGVTLEGRTTVDLARPAEPLPRPFPKNVAVATYTGAAPDVSGWRAANIGEANVAAAFRAENGSILMDLKTGGTAIIFK